ncbi:FMN-dependent NADH-azoreductase [Pseudomonas gingeri NCPPB 3146 = LMG 5327]|uniref:FMN dependent NADH:quinone oxidoreductase n=2 Tax=Pseudomonas gingeri TaxID=117681 RepID=A0A7Y8CC12_9PSED|nr:NAD(P)H-dependent oxidoreductase [Pseudomonas gingeri]NWC13183.1 NAD(P)H-dependent oxidoreductase [Pseudomonas gingeri]PNQ89682.1 FMN-dependent NADH-azoreductase [Pseudomonas gingeri NCPPB 3146 = LMG 5327]
MTTLLHIECSPRKHRSASLEAAHGFIERYRHHRPATEVMTLDLWSEPLPDLDQPAMDAKYAALAGLALSPEQAKAWQRLEALGAPLLKADLIVLSVPLWNFGIPYKLKHFIDLVSHKGILFEFSPERGLEGLLGGRIAVVTYARGLDFSAQSATPAERFDFQKPYVEAWLQFVGITEVHSVTVEKTLLGQDMDEASRRAGAEQAHALADRLAGQR